MAEGFGTGSSQAEALTLLPHFFPITNKMSIGGIEWAGTCTAFHTRASEGTLDTSRTAGLPPLWATLLYLFHYQNEPQVSPICYAEGPGC